MLPYIMGDTIQHDMLHIVDDDALQRDMLPYIMGDTIQHDMLHIVDDDALQRDMLCILGDDSMLLWLHVFWLRLPTLLRQTVAFMLPSTFSQGASTASLSMVFLVCNVTSE
jgi:hypothetical protein